MHNTEALEACRHEALSHLGEETPDFDDLLTDLRTFNDSQSPCRTQPTSKQRRKRRFFQFSDTAMRELTSLGAAFTAYLGIALLIPQPAGIILGVFGALINYAVNRLLLQSNRDDENPEARQAKNTNSRWDRFWYALGLSNFILAISERGIKNFMGVVVTIQEKMPIIGVYVIAAIVTFEAISFYAKTITNAIKKRFAKQEQARTLFLSNARNRAKKQLFNTPYLDFHEPTDSVSLPERHKWATLATSQMNSVCQYITLADTYSPSNYNTFIARTKQVHSDALVAAWLSQCLFELQKQLQIEAEKPNASLNLKHINLNTVHLHLLFKLAENYPTNLAINAYLENQLQAQNAFLQKMILEYDLAGKPTTESALHYFFQHMTEMAFQYEKEKEKTLNSLLLQRPFHAISPKEYLYIRPRKIILYNNVIALFETHFLPHMNIKKNADHVTSQNHKETCFQEKFKKNPITHQALRRAKHANQRSSFLMACAGTLLPALGIAALLPMPFGAAVAVVAYICFVFINYHFIYKQQTDGLAIRIDENLELRDPALAKRVALNSAMAAYALGDTAGKFAVSKNLIEKAFSTMPKFGIFLLAGLLAATALYRAIGYTWSQIQKLYPKPTPPTACEPDPCSPTSYTQIGKKLPKASAPRDDALQHNVDSRREQPVSYETPTRKQRLFPNTTPPDTPERQTVSSPAPTNPKTLENTRLSRKFLAK